MQLVLRINFFTISKRMHSMFLDVVAYLKKVCSLNMYLELNPKQGFTLFVLAQHKRYVAVIYLVTEKYGGNGILKLGIENVCYVLFLLSCLIYISL